MTPVQKSDSAFNPKNHQQGWRGLVLGLLWLIAPQGGYTATLDAGVADDALLSTLVEALAVHDIDVTTNLNSREVVRQRIERPRLGRFPDLPVDTLPSTEEILHWENEFLAGEIGGLAVHLPSALSLQRQEGRNLGVAEWLESGSDARMFITFHANDLQSIESIQQVVNAYSHNTVLFTDPAQVAMAGEFYSTAAQRLALDSRTARRYDSAVTELDYLGERVRRDSNSLIDSGRGNNRLAREEPAAFLKVTLGDEFNQSTIREIVVPGGVALGESARLDMQLDSVAYANGALILVDTNGAQWRLPDMDQATLKALFDFVVRAEIIQSDAIVDIDAEGRVKMAAALRDTDAGYAIMAADTQPFEFVRNLPVTKSVIIDTQVNWQSLQSQNLLQFETEFEVRFLSADNMRIAQTRAALEYAYVSATDSVSYTGSWGRDTGRLHDNIDYIGLGSSVGVVANYAGWIALFRVLHATNIPFLHGRYAFMKVDKTGRSTPARY